MNVFVLDICPMRSARYHVDKHVVKMPLETAQLLSTAIRVCGVQDDALYRPTHKNHPCSLWARRTRNNFEWLILFGLELCDEYTYRYGRVHKSQAVIEQAARHAAAVPCGPMTPFAQAMPDNHRDQCAVSAYRAYYMADKRHIASWAGKFNSREVPHWWT